MHIGIVGAGHAGMEAALAARQAGAEVTVFSAEDVLPYYRPRLIAVAMGQTAPDAIAMHSVAWFEEHGIRLRLATPVTAIHVAERTIVAGGVPEKFDAVVLACGALPRRPHFNGETSGTPVFTLWSMADAIAICKQVRPGARLVVIGGACLGIEAALRASEQKMCVRIMEQMPRLMPLLLGESAASFLQRKLEAKGIESHTGHAVAGFTPTDDGATGVRLDNGTVLDADLVLVCIGAAPHLSLARQAGLAVARGIQTDACLQAAPGIFAAGDVCQAAGQPARGAVREANVQGRLAGSNAVASVTGAALQLFTPVVIPLSVRCAGLEINVAGQAYGEGICEERLDAGAQGSAFRVVTRRTDGALMGVQMIGTREGFDEQAAKIKV